jgi:hypothetical protein
LTFVKVRYILFLLKTLCVLVALLYSKSDLKTLSIKVTFEIVKLLSLQGSKIKSVSNITCLLINLNFKKDNGFNRKRR